MSKIYKLEVKNTTLDKVIATDFYIRKNAALITIKGMQRRLKALCDGCEYELRVDEYQPNQNFVFTFISTVETLFVKQPE